jgi:hypothetical protein
VDVTFYRPPGETLDLKDNGLIVDYTGSTPHNAIKSLITSAYASGAWTGSGIKSSMGNLNTAGVGYAEASELSLSSFLGQTVDSTSMLVRYTYYGDTDLGGQVTLGDHNTLSANYGQSNRRWIHGDTDYDGDVELSDFNRMAGNFGLTSLGGTDDDQGEGFGGQQSYTYEELYAMLMEIVNGG